MVQTRIEERLEVIDQEIALMKKELGKMPIIELSLNDIAKNMQTMQSQSDKQEQMLLMIMETIAKDRTTTGERNEEPNAHTSVTNKGKEKEATSSKSAISGQNNSDDRNEGKIETEEATPDRNKFKKVEMPVFAGEDPDSWLFRDERYFQINKLSDSEKMLVSTISFGGHALNWYRSQEEREKFISWSNLKERLLVRFRSSKY